MIRPSVRLSALLTAVLVAACQEPPSVTHDRSPSRSATTSLAAEPVWIEGGPMSTPRQRHTATLLPSGQVLVVGGHDGAIALATAELYDPWSDTWSGTGSLAVARYGHSATLLPDGRVLVAGGVDANGLLVGAVELYDPATGTFSDGGALLDARVAHTATLLASGKVLFAAGIGSDNPSALAELYDPATHTSSATGPLTVARWGHSATVLPSGQVMVAGGRDAATEETGAAEVYDPGSGTWGLAGTMAEARKYHAATLLPNGTVLVSGGYSSLGLPAPAAVFDPSSGTWADTGALNQARYLHTATLLPGGKVLVAGGGIGGGTESGVDTPTAELFDPASGSFTLVASLAEPRRWHTATLLPNGRVLVTGGNGTADTELFDPMDGTSALMVWPMSVSAPPRAGLRLSATGGAAAGYAWSLRQNASGASLDAVTGTFTAGRTGDVVDVVQVTDASGNVATRPVVVTTGVSVTPGATSVAPGAPRTFAATGGSNTGFRWSLASNASGASIDAASGAYTAGLVAGVSDLVQVSDSLGNAATASVTVGSKLAVLAAVTSLPPGGSVDLSATGGTGEGLVWAITSNASGATFASGRFTAGRTGNVTDVVQVTDSGGNVATLSISVGAGVSAVAAEGVVAPGGRTAVVAAGGSGAGYRYTLHTNLSQASIDATTGQYLAGSVGGVTDEVQVTDSLGNTATARITVDAWSLQGSGGCGSTRGHGGWALALLAAVFLARRRPRLPRLHPLDTTAGRSAVVALLLPLLATSSARADGFANERLQPAGGASDLVGVQSAQVAPHLAPSAAAYLSYASQPLRLTAAGTGTPLLDGQTTLTLAASVGLLDRFELSLAVPVAFQSGGSIGTYGPGLHTPSGSGLGDVVVTPKAQVFSAGPFSGAVAVPVSLPTGDSDAYLGHGSPTASPRVVLEYGTARGLRLAVNAGVALRSTRQQLDLTVGNAATYALGAEVPFRLGGQRLSALATVGGEAALQSGGGDPALEVLGGVTWHGPAGLGVTVGGGPGLSHAYGTPQYRVLTAISFAAPPPERLAHEPEAAPEPPRVAVAAAPPPAPVAAPAPPAPPPGAVTVDAAPRQLGVIRFAFASARLDRASGPALDQMAAELRGDPSLRLTIEGHADRRGPASYNQKLSERRARAVRDALAQRGVPVERMTVAGFGSTRPIDPARTRAAYARNRRVDCLGPATVPSMTAAGTATSDR